VRRERKIAEEDLLFRKSASAGREGSTRGGEIGGQGASIISRGCALHKRDAGQAEKKGMGNKRGRGGGVA